MLSEVVVEVEERGIKTLSGSSIMKKEKEHEQLLKQLTRVTLVDVHSYMGEYFDSADPGNMQYKHPLIINNYKTINICITN